MTSGQSFIKKNQKVFLRFFFLKATARKVQLLSHMHVRRLTGNAKVWSTHQMLWFCLLVWNYHNKNKTRTANGHQTAMTINHTDKVTWCEETIEPEPHLTCAACCLTIAPRINSNILSLMIKPNNVRDLKVMPNDLELPGRNHFQFEMLRFTATVMIRKHQNQTHCEQISPSDDSGHINT